ncbi:MAG: ATP-binding cassette domain-containing protein [Deltaproteobacteria bacterium]|nr:ATP-binding cassette domain-containing protein [Deltaproteobacteria bacterium]
MRRRRGRDGQRRGRRAAGGVAGRWALKLLELAGVRKYYATGSSLFGRSLAVGRAVDGVDLGLDAGETLGLVGESGCGKSTLGRLVLGLERPTAGAIRFQGRDIHALARRELKAARREMQMVFQDPYSSLDPRKKVGEAIGEPLSIHRICSGREKEARVLQLMEDVGLRPEHANRYPHQFSGGQRQRIGIARALSVKPRLIVCDEAVSALDVSIQAQVLNLLQDLQQKYGLTYLFISHDLGVIGHLCDRVSVMYLGQIVEAGARDAVFDRPLHPYTPALLSASPSATVGPRARRPLLKGEVPSVFHPPAGCRFHTRCPQAKAACREEAPDLVDAGQGHGVRCLEYPGARREVSE